MNALIVPLTVVPAFAWNDGKTRSGLIAKPSTRCNFKFYETG